jgi:hypothetical protein
MVSETLVTGIMTASVTGAGLIIAYYAFVASMSSEIFQRRADKLEKKHDEIRKIREDTQAFETETLDKTTKKLKDLSDEVNVTNTFPSYLGFSIFLDFVLFVVSAVLALNWLATDITVRGDSQWFLLEGVFLASMVILFFVGCSGIYEVYGVMKDRFEKLKKGKEDAQRDASLGPA